MQTKVELINNPFKQHLRILINGKAVSVYSNLEKYIDEPFYYWCDKILDVIYEECNGEDFQLSFSSRKEEMEVMEKLAGEYDHCKQYTSISLTRSTSLQARMKDLNNLVKGLEKSEYRVFEEDVLFLMPESLERLRGDLAGMEVKNAFCKINASTAYYSDFPMLKHSADVYILISDDDNVGKKIEQVGLSEGFAIILGDGKSFKKKQDGFFIYESTEELLFETIFDCLLLIPLMEIFNNSIKNISSCVREKYHDKIEELQGIDIRILPIPESTVIEEGLSSRIRFESDMNGVAVNSSSLHFSYSDDGIIKCNGLLVEGLKQGNATLFVFREGDMAPCASISFTVIRRNRISDLKIDEGTLVIGEGDHAVLNLVYLPENADNADKIEWESDNELVATVDRKGNVYGKSEGTCIIRCFAEQVSAKCCCVVKPHLMSISVDESEIDLLYGQEEEIRYHLSPENCIDDHIIISSLDMRIVNIVGNRLRGIGIGETKVVIQNREETRRSEILVRVMNEKDFRKMKKKRKKSQSSEKKGGLISRLFD